MNSIRWTHIKSKRCKKTTKTDKLTDWTSESEREIQKNWLKHSFRWTNHSVKLLPNKKQHTMLNWNYKSAYFIHYRHIEFLPRLHIVTIHRSYALNNKKRKKKIRMCECLSSHASFSKFKYQRSTHSNTWTYHVSAENERVAANANDKIRAAYEQQNTRQMSQLNNNYSKMKEKCVHIQLWMKEWKNETKTRRKNTHTYAHIHEFTDTNNLKVLKSERMLKKGISACIAEMRSFIKEVNVNKFAFLNKK